MILWFEAYLAYSDIWVGIGIQARIFLLILAAAVVIGIIWDKCQGMILVSILFGFMLSVRAIIGLGLLPSGIIIAATFAFERWRLRLEETNNTVCRWISIIMRIAYFCIPIALIVFFTVRKTFAVSA